MKPRRENGATFVSPMKSGVCRGSALMVDFLKGLAGMRIQQAIPAKHKSPACEDLRDARTPPSRPAKKTRPPAEYDACPALPCPDIEIGLRRPVNYRVHGRGDSQCDPFHNRHKKVAAGSLRRRGTARYPVSGLPRTGNGVNVAIWRVCDAWRCILIGSSCFVSSADWMLR